MGQEEGPAGLAAGFVECVHQFQGCGHLWLELLQRKKEKVKIKENQKIKWNELKLKVLKQESALLIKTSQLAFCPA